MAPTDFAFCPRDGRPFKPGEAVCAACRAPRDPQTFVEASAVPGPASATPASAIGQSNATHTDARANSASGTRPDPHRAWRKVLYIRQPFPDNHIDDSFLDELQRNVNVRTYDYWELVSESASISQQVSSVALFAVLFYYTMVQTLSGRFVFGLGTVLSLLAFLLWDTVMRPDDVHGTYSRGSVMRGAVLFFTTLLGLSPILKTLTEDTSSDTVWALVTLLFLANILFHDYSSSSSASLGKYPAGSAVWDRQAMSSSPGSLSLNAAIFASVMLASRLRSVLDVFAFLAFAMEWFALFPIFRQRIKSKSRIAHASLTWILVTVTSVLLYTISFFICVVYMAAIVLLSFLTPYWLIWIQRYKKYG